MGSLLYANRRPSASAIFVRTLSVLYYSKYEGYTLCLTIAERSCVILYRLGNAAYIRLS